MKATSNKHCNLTLTRPDGMSENQCADLPVLRCPGDDDRPPSVSSFWQPDRSEIETLKRGGQIMLTVLGTTHPPLALTVIQP